MRPRSIPDFAIFVFTGLTAWGLYSEIITAGTNSIVSNSGLVKKVYVPREIFPLAAVGASISTSSSSSSILRRRDARARPARRCTPTWHTCRSACCSSSTFATALALVLSALNVYLRDVQHLIEILLLVLFWASPIVYSMGFVHVGDRRHLLEEIYLANPVTLGVLGMQKAHVGLGVRGSDAVLARRSSGSAC